MANDTSQQHRSPKGDLPQQVAGRGDSVAKYAAARKQRSVRKVVRGVLIALACVIGVVGLLVFAYINNLNSRLTAGIDAALRKNLTVVENGKPFYMLLLGVDKSSDRVNSAEYGADDSAYRTDSIMLARIDPTNHKVTLVSIHRDTLVDLGEHGEQKINAAYSIGGPSYTTEVVSEFADVPISHYAEIDFDNFVSVVDTIGGIEVDVPVRVDDSAGTGQIIEAGKQTLNGEQALVLCRARHAYDSYGDGDVYRAANQRMVISTIAKKILTLDPATMVATINQLAGSITTDFDVQSIISLATQLRDINLDTDVYSGMEPTTSLYTHDTWYEICDIPAWRTMMERVNQGLSPFSSEDQDETAGIVAGVGSINNTDATTPDTATSSAAAQTLSDVEGTHEGMVEVLNGTSVAGLAGRWAQTFTDQGFTTTTGDATATADTTTIYYNGDAGRAVAKTLLESLGPDVAVEANDGTYDTESDVVVVLGANKSDH